jgi:hypothetical protein
MDRRGEKIRRPSPQNQTCRDVAVDRPHWHAEPARIRYAWYARGLVRNTLNLCIGSPVFHIRGPSSCTIEAPIPDDISLRHVQRRGTVVIEAHVTFRTSNWRGFESVAKIVGVALSTAKTLAYYAGNHLAAILPQGGATALRFQGSASCKPCSRSRRFLTIDLLRRGAGVAGARVDDIPKYDVSPLRSCACQQSQNRASNSGECLP